MPQVNIRLSWLFTPTLILFCARLQERVSAICELRCDLIAIHRLAPPTKVSEFLASAVDRRGGRDASSSVVKKCAMQDAANLQPQISPLRQIPPPSPDARVLLIQIHPSVIRHVQVERTDADVGPLSQSTIFFDIAWTFGRVQEEGERGAVGFHVFCNALRVCHFWRI